MVIIIRWNEFKRNLLDYLRSSLPQLYYWNIDTLKTNESFKVNKHNISYNVDTPIKVLYKRKTFSSLLAFDWYQSCANVPISQNYKLFLLQLITRFLKTSTNWLLFYIRGHWLYSQIFLKSSTVHVKVINTIFLRFIPIATWQIVY